MTPHRLFVVLVLAACTTACEFQRRSSLTSPSDAPVVAAAAGSMLGVWTAGASTTAVLPPGLPTTGTGCSKFEWFVTSQSANAISGDFTATCLGSITLSGTARGERNGSAVQVTVNGAAVLPGMGNCTFSLSSTGTIESNDAVRLPYSGTTCLGPVSGVETLRRNPVPAAPAPSPPAPVPAPTPPPPPPPPPVQPGPGDGSECSYLANDKEALVRCVHDLVRPARTVEGAFEVTKRVAWALRHQGGGLLIKNGGENIVPWQGYWFSAGRVCFPDGHIYKVLTDIPSTNGPSWQDNDFVDRSLYVPAINPNR